MSTTLLQGILAQGQAIVYEDDPVLFFEENKSELTGNSSIDVLLFQIDTLTIDDARAIREKANRRGVKENRLVVIATFTITREAQNALLKILEEGAAQFLIVIPRKDLLLETVLSRVQSITGPDRKGKKLSTVFLATLPSKRLSVIEPLLDTKHVLPRELRAKGFIFLRELENLLYTQGIREPKVWKDLWLAKTYLEDQSSQPKMIFEHLAAALPVIP